MSETIDTRDMDGEDVRDARGVLGEMWGVGRPLHRSELGRALRFSGRDPGSQITRYEEGDPVTGKGVPVSGPVSVALAMMLAGAAPPDPLPSILRASRRTAAASAPSAYTVGDVFDLDAGGQAILIGDNAYGYALAPLYDVVACVSRVHPTIDGLAAKLGSFGATWTDDVHRDDVAVALAIFRLTRGEASAVEDLTRLGLPVAHRRSFERAVASVADSLLFHLERARAPLLDGVDGEEDFDAASAAQAAEARRYEETLRAVRQARLWPAA